MAELGSTFKVSGDHHCLIMPALTAFRRQWNIGSDDFVFPGISMLIIRLAWFITIAGVYATHHEHLNQCKDVSVLNAFLIGMLCLLSMKAIINILLIYHSSRGLIRECSSRRGVVKVLYVKLTLFVLELGWLVLGSFWATAEASDCDTTVVNTIRVLIGLSWIGVVVFVIMFVFLFSPLGNDSSAIDGAQTWRRRCRLICCTWRKEDPSTSDAYTDIASIVSDFFQDVDLVPSDIAAGLLLVSRNQRRSYNRGVSEDSTSRHIYGDRHEALGITDYAKQTSSVAPWMTVHKAARVARYALAVYGWPLYSLMHLPIGCCVLCCTSPRTKLSGEQVVGRDMCSCNLVSMEKHLDGRSYEIFHSSFSNELFINPFTIFLDHETKSVVLSIRGSLSLKDAIVDLTALGEEIDDSLPKTFKAHKGIVRSSRNLVQRLKDTNLLTNAFTGQSANYELVVCGHSLGAGVAVISSMLLRQQYPHLKCIAYSPPGGLLSEEAYKATKEFTLSVVLGDDLFARLSIQSMQELKVKVMNALNSCSHPKYQVFCSLPFRAFNCRRCLLDDEEMSSPLVSESSRSDSSYTIETNHSIHSGYQEAVESRDLLRIQPPFYAPGCIMYILPSADSTDRNCCFKDTGYTWRWADQTEFLTLKVTPMMGDDHTPHHVTAALEALTPDFPEAIVADQPSSNRYQHVAEA